MKVRLTEGQYDMVKLLREGEESIGIFKDTAASVNDKLNGIFTKLRYSTISEILEGDVKIKELNDTLTQLSQTFDKDWMKYEFFSNEMKSDNEDLWYDKLGDVDNDMESLKDGISNKIDIIENLLYNFISLMDSNVEEVFKDNRAISINNIN